MDETKKSAKVLVVMGSDSDLKVTEPASAILDRLGIPYEFRVASAHRTPEMAVALAREAARSGVAVIIAVAGGAAHLAGVMASQTLLPVLGVPVAATPLGGIDAMFATAQMPKGIPVGCMAVGGTANAALLAARIIAINDENVRNRLEQWQKELRQKVRDADVRVQALFNNSAESDPGGAGAD
ncbi:MAG: 5-(carboxyamino)imidazole ribonucleotide mutase [Deltaproteobacteria bacterium]|nr:5-(carboxyamino)imidazole ribonucleotide mutase [Deltaproteobacteria bacterium]